MRYNPADKDAIFTSEGAREIFLAYMGGVYDHPNGLALLLSWVMNAFFPSTTTKLSEHEPANDLEPNQNLHLNGLDGLNQYRTTDESPPMLPFHKPRPSFPDTLHFPEPPRSIYSTPLKRDVPPHMAHGFMARPSVTFLPRFNEITTRRRLDVQWLAEQTGMQHAPLWTIECFGECPCCSLFPFLSRST